MRVLIKDVQRYVANYYRVPIEIMTADDKVHETAHIRYIAMYFARMMTSKSLPDIGYYFGGKDHTTILYGVRFIEDAMRTDRKIRDDVADIGTRIGAAIHNYHAARATVAMRDQAKTLWEMQVSAAMAGAL